MERYKPVVWWLLLLLPGCANRVMDEAPNRFGESARALVSEQTDPATAPPIAAQEGVRLLQRLERYRQPPAEPVK